MTSYFLDFVGSPTYRLKKKSSGISGILQKLKIRTLCFLCRNIDLKIRPYLACLPLIRPTFKVYCDLVIKSNDHHFRYRRAKWPIKHVSHVL